MNRLILFVISFFLLNSLSSQSALYSSYNKKAIKLYEKAIECYQDISPFSGRGNLKGAEEYLLKSLAKDSTFSEAYILLSQVKVKMGDINSAIFYKEKMMTVNPIIPLVEYFYLAGMHMAIGSYEKCLKNAVRYKNSPLADQRYIGRIDKMIENCEFAIEAIKNPVDFNPINLGSSINSELPEYFPSITADDSTFLFTRRVNDLSAPGGRQEEIFVSKKTPNNHWSNSSLVSNAINSKYNEGAPTFSPDGQYIIFVGCETGAKGDYEYGDDRKGYGSCDLFYSQNNGTNWSKPVNLGSKINSKHWETQPSFSSDGKTLYFIRGMTYDRQRRNPDNQDIYVTTITEDGQWSKPEKLPPNINSPHREESVQIHPDGKTLYFSSNGHPGMGGMDLYMSRKLDDNTWSDPINLGYPLNTYKNDISILISPKGDKGYFSSDREGGYGDLDLYSFNVDKKFKPLPITFIKGKIIDAESKLPLFAFFQLTDLKKGNIISQMQSKLENGEFLITVPKNIDFALHAEKEGYMFYSRNIYRDNLSLSKDGFLIIELEKVKPGTFILENIFFEKSKSSLKKSSLVELNKVLKLMQINPDLKIQISGHTDSDGDDDFNLELSINRAKSVVNWLIENNIDQNRLSFKGYGETRPIEENNSIANKAKNRRTELTIIE
jgi:outer membrane protein OmpA-like peptidoglycan-associated protein/Tol biopolymer transport system component